MSNYIFLTKNFTEGPTIYFAIPADKIETLNLSDTYDQFGQIISSCDAGDSIELLSEKAVAIANKELENENEGWENTEEDLYKIGAVISAYDSHHIYDTILEGLEKHCIEGEDFNAYKETVKGCTYWNGHNWQTVTVSKDYGEPSHSIIDDENLVAELNEAIENKEFEKERFGIKIYKAGGYVIVDNYCQGAWASYELTTEEEIEITF